MSKQAKNQIVARNRKAFYDYEIITKLEAGVSLKGTEIKAIRAGKVNLKNAYVSIVNNEALLEGCHISEYDMGSHNNHDPLRSKKLLLHKKEIKDLSNKAKQKGLTVVPLSMYFVGNKIKVEISLAQGKKHWDKRNSLAKKDSERKIQQAVKASSQS